LDVSDASPINNTPGDEFSPLYNLVMVAALGLGIVGFVAHSVVVAVLVPRHRFVWLCTKFGPLAIWWISLGLLS
jgi:hypothetical protein